VVRLTARIDYKSQNWRGLIAPSKSVLRLLVKLFAFIALLVFTPFLTLGQKAVNSELITKASDLSNKTFIIREEGDYIKSGKDLHLLFIFHKDGNATFRVKKGNTITKDSPLSWRFVRDSLCLQTSPMAMEMEGKTQIIDREPMKYAIVKTPSGHLLKGKDDQMLLVELK
jgi:hypothetical protein